MTTRILILALLVPILPFTETFAGLDYIDADGVTETGGPGKGRMLPRTKADGTLDVSLLPDLGSLASTPDPKRLYVSATAQPDGNGSALAPFQTLQEAFAHVQTGGAILVAPGLYTGSHALPASSSVTLVGCGPSTRFTSLSVQVSGSAAATELQIVSADITTLNLTGGQVKLRLLGSQVATLTGDASPLTVVRNDLGSKVGTVTASAATDSYDGYDTVPYATTLKGASANLVMTGTRPTVGAEVCAFVSDIGSATNAVYAVLEEFRAADALLATAVANERTERLQGDADLTTAIVNTKDALDEKIEAIGGNWQTQLTVLSQAIGKLSEGLSELTVQETNDVARLDAEDTAIRADFAAADTSLHTTVRGEISDAVGALEGRVPGIAHTQAENVLSMRHDELINDAKTAIRPEITTVANNLAALNGTVSGHTTTLSAHTSQLSAIPVIKSKINEIITVVNQYHKAGIQPL